MGDLDLAPNYYVEDVAVVYKETPDPPIRLVEQGNQREVEAGDLRAVDSDAAALGHGPTAISVAKSTH